MAICEKCGTSGLDMKDMVADEKKQFVGPCCVKSNPAKAFDKGEVEYGIEFSSHMGLRAYASYGGLAIEFKKTKEELAQWAAPKNPEEVPLEEKTVEQTTSQTMN